MEDWNDIVFLDSEIVEDDDDAPVGTLLKHENTVSEIAEQQDKSADTANEVPVLSQSQNEQEEPIQESQIEETELEEQLSDDGESIEDQPVEELSEANTTPITDDDQVAVHAEDNQNEMTDDEVEEPTDVTETVEEELVEKVEEPAPVVAEQTEEQVVEPVEEVESNEVVEEQEKTAEHSLATLTTQNQDTKPASNVTINLKGTESINDALFDTSFEIERPKQAKVVSIKKKQEKEIDPWSVAPIAQKKTVKGSTVETKTATKQQPTEEKKPTKRMAQQKVESEKVAKVAADKQTKPATKKIAPKQEQAQPTATTKVDNKKTKAEDNKKMAKEAVTVKENDWIQEPTEKYAGTYVIKKTDKGNFVFKLFAYNKNCLAIGAQPYTSIAGCKGGINSIIKNAATAPVANLTLKNPENTDKFPRWEIYQDKKGEFRLRLIASNGNLVATTNDGYMQASGAKKGIESIAKASIGCGIKRDDNLW